jgi:hypothetical protein
MPHEKEDIIPVASTPDPLISSKSGGDQPDNDEGSKPSASGSKPPISSDELTHDDVVRLRTNARGKKSTRPQQGFTTPPAPQEWQAADPLVLSTEERKKLEDVGEAMARRIQDEELADAELSQAPVFTQVGTPANTQQRRKAASYRKPQEHELALKANNIAWLNSAAAIDLWKLTLEGSPKLRREILAAVRQSTEEKIDELLQPRRGESGFLSLLRSTTAYNDIKGDQAVREALKSVEFHFAGEGEQPANLMDITRNAFLTVSNEIAQLTENDLGAHADFLKEKMIGDIDRLAHTLSRTAYDQTGGDRTAVVATVLSSMLMTTLPFAFAMVSVPTAWFYLSNLSAAYARTLCQTIGLAKNPGTSHGMTWKLVRERHLIWGIPSIAFGIPTFTAAAAREGNGGLETGTPEQTKKQENLVAAATKLIHGFENPGVLTVIGLAEFAIFAGTNHPDVAKKLARAIGNMFHSQKSLESSPEHLFASGQLGAAQPLSNNLANVRDDFLTAAEFLNLYRGMGKRFIDENETSYSETAIFAEVDKDLSQLRTTMEKILGQLGQLTLLDQDDLNQKRSIVGPFLIVGAVLAAVSCVAVRKFLPLLADYVPFYIATELLIGIKAFDQTTTPSELARIFGSYFGGTVLGIPFSATNLAFTEAYGAGAFDFVKEDGYPAKNATDAQGFPILSDVENAGKYSANGISFGVGTALQILLTLAFAGSIGSFIAMLSLKMMEKKAETPEEVKQVQQLRSGVEAALAAEKGPQAFIEGADDDEPFVADGDIEMSRLDPR